MNTCENCGKQINKKDICSMRFCCKSCARAFSTKGDNSKETKKAVCIDCGKSIFINKRASLNTARCIKCKDLNIKIKKSLKSNYSMYNKSFEERPKCKFCGERYHYTQLTIHERTCDNNPNFVKKGYNYKRSDKRTGYIYLTTNLLNGKIYIGKKADSWDNSVKYLGSGILLRSAIKKYGESNFKKLLLEEVFNGDLNERERHWISVYNSTDLNIGYNLTKGGDGGALFKGRHHSDETKKLISNKVKKYLAGCQ